MSIKELSSGGLYAKVKACSTALFSEEEYSKLASLESLSDFALHLKNKTEYAKAFENIGAGVRITRLHLEAVIRKMALMRLEKIIRYAVLTDNYVADYLLMKHETECIVSRLRQHDTYAIDSYFLYMPDGFFTGTSFDIKALEQAKSIEEILDVLKNTEYEKVLAPVLENQNPGLLIPENLLYRHLYETGAENFKKKLNAKDYAEVKELLSTLSDMITLNSIYRIKKYYPDAHDAMMLHTFSSSLTNFTESRMSALKKASDASEFTRVLEQTGYKELVRLFDSASGAIFTKKYVYDVCKKKFAASNNAALSALCYSKLVNTESDNLITLVEGISAGLDAESICPMLTV